MIGRIEHWNVADGAFVEKGEFICEISWGDATQEIQAYRTGILRKLKYTNEFLSDDEIAFRIEPIKREKQ